MQSVTTVLTERAYKSIVEHITEYFIRIIPRSIHLGLCCPGARGILVP